jgi:putative endonuclease
MAIARQRQILGQKGEAEAVQFLRGLGYVIVEQNYRSPFGEVDVIAEDGQVLVFVEVRSHSRPEYGDPLESVNVRKQRQVAKTAQHYLLRYGLENREARFDVIGIQWDAGHARLSHIPGAFELPRSW